MSEEGKSEFQIVVELIGPEKAELLCAHMPGDSPYVPSKPPSPKCRLAKIIGPEAVVALSEYFGGTTITIPLKRRTKLDEAADMVRKGATIAETCRAITCCRSTALEASRRVRLERKGRRP